MLRIEGLCKSFFGVQVLHEVGLELNPGQVLGLVGENGSGKSTTMNILGGVHRPDRGTMTLDGEGYAPARPQGRSRARDRVHPPGAKPVQEPDGRGEPVHRRVPELIGGLPFIDRSKVRARSKELLAAIELDIAPGTPVARLSQGERQLVEIAKALGADARIVIFDEPTTSLTSRESERLFAQIGRLRARGIAVIYISHILGDVMRLCDRITVLRDGHVVGSGPRAEMTIDRLITLMVGRTIDQIYPPREPAARPGTPVLAVTGLSQPGVVRGISFGAAGRGRGCGGPHGLGPLGDGPHPVRPRPQECWHDRGRRRAPARADPAGCDGSGIAFLTEDRRAEGLMMGAAIADNMRCPRCNYAAGWGRLLERTRLGDAVSRTGRDVQVTASDFVRTLVKNLSGGNQQKVVIGKWLLRGPGCSSWMNRPAASTSAPSTRSTRSSTVSPPRYRHPDDLLGDRRADRHVRPHSRHGPRRDQGRVRTGAIRPRGHPAPRHVGRRQGVAA